MAPASCLNGTIYSVAGWTRGGIRGVAGMPNKDGWEAFPEQREGFDGEKLGNHANAATAPSGASLNHLLAAPLNL